MDLKHSVDVIILKTTGMRNSEPQKSTSEYEEKALHRPKQMKALPLPGQNDFSLTGNGGQGKGKPSLAFTGNGCDQRIWNLVLQYKEVSLELEKRSCRIRDRLSGSWHKALQELVNSIIEQWALINAC